MSELICCDQVFLSGFTYKKHLKTNHFKGDKSITGEKLICVLSSCNKGYKYLSSYLNHLNKFHLDLLNKNLRFNQNQIANPTYDYSDNFENFFELPENSQMNQANIKKVIDQIVSAPRFNNISESSLEIDEGFAILLQQTKVETKSNQKQINTISSNILGFLNKNEIVDSKTYSSLARVANSTYIQQKICNKFLNNDKMIHKIDKELYGGEFYVVDTRKTLEHVLSDKSILRSILENRFGKLIYN
jgi:uncharacterized C2H2 Zn-finger protein